MSYNAGVFIAGREALLVDPGLFPDEIDRIKAHIYERGASPTYVVLTHSHWDHVLGPEYFPGVPVVQQQESAAVFAEHHARIEHQVTEWERRSGVQRDMPFLMPEPDETFDDRLDLRLGDRTIELLHMPGHAPEQLVVYDPGEGVLWAADMLSDIEIPFVMHSLSAYRRTLDRLAQLDVRMLVPGHGRPVRSSAEAKARFDTDREYLGELQRRVEAAVAEGRSADDTITGCDDMGYPNREQNEDAHRLNVETAFIEFAGKPEPGHEGWNRFR
jgi:glyoxylase-like metal-dependent hydrolase (beta-lactamase superfamily II)